MKSFVAASLLAVPALARAQDLNFQDYKRFLLQGAQQGSNAKMAITTTCKNAAGETFRIGDKGYDTCMNSLKKAAEASQKNSTDKNREPASNNAGVSTTIEISK